MRRKDQGYASVAAVGALAVLSAVAYLISTSDRSAVAALTAQASRAQMEAAAEAGLNLAVQGLSPAQPEQRWRMDGTPHRLSFQGMDLQVSVQDEHGKISLAQLTDPGAVRLFQDLGLADADAADLAQSLLDWIDTDHDPRPQGAEASVYAPLGLKPRDQLPLTLDELIRVRGMDARILARVEPLVTTSYDLTGGFDSAIASPQALDVAAAAGDQSPQAIQDRVEQLAGRGRMPSEQPVSLVGRRITVDIRVKAPSADSFSRRCMIEMTGSPDTPFVIRSCEDDLA